MLKKLSIFAVLLIIIGVVGAVLTYKPDEIKAITEKKSMEMTSVDSVTISSISADVEVISSKTATQASVELIGQAKSSQMPTLKAKVMNGELVIDAEIPSNEKFFNIDFSFGFHSPSFELIVILPEKQYNNLDITTVSGDLYIEEISSLDTLISTVSGDVEIETLAGEVEISTTSGDVYFFNPTIEAAMLIETVSGEVEIEVDSSKTNATVKTDSISGDSMLLYEETNFLKLGDGTHLIDISSVSGDIEFYSND